MDPVRILTIMISLGLVIFVHELGHFLVARWCGVLVERFSIGFGPILFSIRRGETEYAISAIPLGGYVKMLGQTDTPEVEEVSDDERSYQNKSVPKRMAIISAGVIMNLIFGFLCFVVAYWYGVPYQPAVVGVTLPNKPAWIAGIQPGDRMVEINGGRAYDFETLLTEVALTRPPHGHVDLVMQRGEEKLHFDLQPIRDDLKPMIGISPSLGLQLWPKDSVQPSTPAAKASNPGFEAEDTVIAVNGEPVTSHFDYIQKSFAHQTETITVRVQRKPPKSGAAETPQEVDIPVEPNFVRVVGLRMQMGPVVGVQTDSPAMEALDSEGKPSPIQAKDIIVAVDGERDIDPMRLPDVIVAKAGQPVELTLLRPGTEEKEVKLTVIPRSTPTWQNQPHMVVVGEKNPLTIPSIGVAYQVLPTIRKVIEEGPAARSTPQLQAQDVISKVVLHVNVGGETKDIQLEVTDDTWPNVFWNFQYPGIEKITLVAKRSGSEEPIQVTLSPERDTNWPLWFRGLNFQPEEALQKATGLADATALGLHRTRSSVLNLYLFLRGLFLGDLSPMNLAGPLTIAKVAYTLAGINIPLLILFMGSLNINLAVVNFLPIPILDGGHMVFLLYEGIMRRKPTERMILAANYLGLLMILSLMLFVFGLDIFRMAGLADF